jgi:hypothetical protein
MLLRSIGAAVRRHPEKVGANQAVLTSPRNGQVDGARFENGHLVKRPDESAGDQQAA